MLRLHVILLLAFCLLGLPWPAAPASAASSIGTTAVTPSSITADTATTVTATAQIVGGTPIAGGVNLIRQDATGKTTAILGVMHDDGLNGDAAAGDNVYTLQVPLTEPAGTVYFAVTAAIRGQLKRLVSAPFTVTVNPVPAPTITGFAPPSAAVGDSVTVTGTNLTPAGGGLPQVTLNKLGGGTVGAAVTSATATSLTFTVPAGADSGKITVTVNGQSGVSAAALTVLFAPPVLTPAATEATVIQGFSTTYTLSFGPEPGFTQLAALSVSGLPAGLTTGFAPSQITSGQFSLLTVSAPATQPVGTFSFSVTASAVVNGVPQSQSLMLTLHVIHVTTSFIGRTVVADNAETPLAGVRVTFLGRDGQGNPTGANATTVSDASGNFSFTDLPANYVGQQLIQYDGLTATSPPGKYCGVDLRYTLVANNVTTSPVLIHLPRLDNAETVMVPQNAATDQTFTFKTIPNLSITVYAHTTISMPDGTQPDPFPLIALQVPVDRLPDVMPPMPGGVAGFIVAFQPANTVSSQPIAVTFPETLMTPPGTNVVLSTLDPTKGIMVQYGTGTVSPDGTQVIPDLDPANPGHRYGLVHFDWHLAEDLANLVNGTLDFLKKCTGFPVDLATGLESVSATDIGISGPRGSVALTRNYRTFTNIVGPFGLGGSHNYNYRLGVNRFLLDIVTLASDNLVMPDGGQVPFALHPDGTLTNSTIPAMRGAVITLVGDKEADLRWKDGTVLHFGPDTYLNGPVLTRITDRNGNVITVARDPAKPLNVTKVTDPVGRSLTFTYDSSNRITSVTDPLGRRVSYTYNAQGALGTVTDVSGGVTTYGYETANGNQTELTTITDPRGIQDVKNTYDGNGRVIQQDMADGGSLTIDYTLLNPLVPTSPVLKTVLTDPLGRKTTYRYSPQGFLLSITDPSGQQQTFKVDSGTNLLADVKGIPSDASSVASPGDAAFTYDANGNILTATDALGQTTKFTYEPVYNQITSVTDANGHTSGFAYDAHGNLLTATDANGKTSKLTYNGTGQVLTATDPLGKVTQFSYDPAGDLNAVTDALGHSAGISYDAVSRPIRATDPLGRVSSVQYDNLNRVLSTTDPLGHAASFTYDPNGNLLTLTDALGHVNTFTYDSMNRPLTRKTPLGKMDTRQYDLAGNLTKFTDRRGQVSKFAYDPLDQLIGEVFQDGSTVATTYDAYGRPLNIADTAGGAFTYAYDLDSRLIGQSSPTGSIQYVFDNAGELLSRQVGGQPAAAYAYDPAGRLLSAALAGTGLQFTYDDRGEVTGITRANGVGSQFSYDDAGRLTALAHAKGAATLYSQTYAYDAAGQRTISALSAAQPFITQPVVNAYDAENHLLTNGPNTNTYDANGNLTAETGPGGTTAYTWDTRGRLVTLTRPDNSTLNFTYDPGGEMIAQTDSASGLMRSYLLDALTNVVAYNDGLSGQSAVLTGLGIDSHFAIIAPNGSAEYGLTDALGSTTAVADGSGSVAGRFAYEPFGQTTATGAAANYPFQYTGRVPVSNSLYYNRARFYNTAVGRFISEDPIGFAGSINLYGYTENSPTGFVDPSGLRTLQIGGTVNVGVSLPKFLGPFLSKFGFSGTVFFGVAFDDMGNSGLYGGFGGGGGGGEIKGVGRFGNYVTGGASVACSDAKNIYDLRGPFNNASGTAGDGVAASLEGFEGSSDDGTVHGIGTTVGVGAGLGGSVLKTNTGVIGFDSINNFINQLAVGRFDPSNPYAGFSPVSTGDGLFGPFHW